MPLLAVLTSPVDPLYLQQVCENLQGIHEVDTVLDEVDFPLPLVPLEHRRPVYGNPYDVQDRTSWVAGTVCGHATPAAAAISANASTIMP